MIPALDLERQLAQVRPEVNAAMARVLDRGRFILGPEVESFEREFAAAGGAAHGVGVASGTDAIRIALSASGVGAGAEVITSAFTAVASLAAIELAGAKPVLVDIDPEAYQIDPQRIPAAMSDRTAAILPVHLYGLVAPLEPILALACERGLAVVEDCAQAAGALYRGKPVGAWGSAGAHSFYPTKNLGALGDGGMLVTSDEGIAGRAGQLREYGWDAERISRRPGLNSRLDELQAAILRVKLAHLEHWNAERRAIAAQYGRELEGTGIRLPKPAPDTLPAYHAFVIRHPARDALRRHLAGRGIGTLIHYPMPAHMQPGFRHLGYREGDFPETEAATREVISLPLYPGLHTEEVSEICAAIRDFLQKG